MCVLFWANAFVSILLKRCNIWKNASSQSFTWTVRVSMVNMSQKGLVILKIKPLTFPPPNLLMESTGKINISHPFDMYHWKDRITTLRVPQIDFFVMIVWLKPSARKIAVLSHCAPQHPRTDYCSDGREEMQLFMQCMMKAYYNDVLSLP